MKFIVAPTVTTVHRNPPNHTMCMLCSENPADCA